MNKSLWFTLVAGLAAQVYYFQSNPELVANHFGRSGMANGWMSNQANLVISCVALIINSMIFLSVPLVFKHVPVRYISFPNKSYWLSPERKAESIYLMTQWVVFFGVVTNLLLIAVFHMVYLANHNNPARMNEQGFVGLLGIYFVVLILWLILLYRRFKKPPAGA